MSLFLNYNDSLFRPRNRISWALKSISFGHVQKMFTTSVHFLPRTSTLIEVLIRERDRQNIGQMCMTVLQSPNFTYIMNIVIYVSNMKMLVGVRELISLY